MGKPKRQNPFIIDPRKSKRIGYWDAAAGVALCYTAIVTPFEVALLPAASSPLDPLFLVNQLVNLIFIIAKNLIVCWYT